MISNLVAVVVILVSPPQFSYVPTYSVALNPPVEILDSDVAAVFGQAEGYACSGSWSLWMYHSSRLCFHFQERRDVNFRLIGDNKVVQIGWSCSLFQVKLDFK